MVVGVFVGERDNTIQIKCLTATILQVMQTAFELSKGEKRLIPSAENETQLNLCCLSGTQQSANKSHNGK